MNMKFQGLCEGLGRDLCEWDGGAYDYISLASWQVCLLYLVIDRCVEARVSQLWLPFE